MPFDVNAAIKEGYSPTEIADFLGQNKKFDVESARKEGYSDNEIIQHLNPVPKKQSLLNTLSRSVESVAGDLQTAGAGILNPTEAAKAGLTRDEALREKYGTEESRLSKVEQAYKDKGLLSAIGTGLGEIPGAITEQLPQFGMGFAGARTGAALGSLAGPVGAVAGGIGGAFLPFFLQQYGGNIKKQAEVQKEEGKEIDVSGAKGAAYAVPMAGLDVAEAFIPFGGKMIGKMFGPSVERLLARGMTKEAEEAAAKKLASETFLPSFKNKDFGSVVKGVSKTTALEVPTEVTQQILERAQAGQDLFSKEAMREYGETAFDIALLGPLGILGRVSDKSAARNTILKAQQEAAKLKEPVETSIEVAPLQLPYDPKVENGEVINSSVYSRQKIIVHPDGSTSFPSEANNFTESPVDELTDKGFKEKYTPQENENAVELARIEERKARREAKQAGTSNAPMYVGSEGQAGQDVNAVSEEGRKLAIVRQAAQEKQDLLNNSLTPELLKSWGIKGKPITVQDVMGKDIRDPEQAPIIKAKLLELQKKTTIPAVKKNITEYLKRPEFGTQTTENPVAPTTPSVGTMPKTEDLLTEPPISESELWSGIQNRDRSTPASIKQMNNIANKPNYLKASYSNSFTEGAPVVTGDVEIPKEQLGRKGTVIGSDDVKIPVQYAVIDAGQVQASHDVNGTKNPNYTSEDFKGLRSITNGRVAGMQAAYARGTMDDYITDLTHDDMHGIKKSVIKNMKNPMLVRIMPQDMITKHIGDVSNVGAGLTMNVIEQAKNDIRRIDINNLQFTEDGDISSKTVIDFIRGMPEVEQNSLMTKGVPSRQAYDRLDAAIFQEAYQNDTLTQLAFAEKDNKIRTIIKALTMAAPSAIHLEGLGEYDVRPYVNEAVEMAINARKKEMKLSDMLEQMNRQDSFVPIHPISKDVFSMLADDVRSGKAMGDNLNKLFDNAFDEATKEPDMFGGLDKKPVHEVVKESFEEKPETDLLNQVMQQREGKPSLERDLFSDLEELTETTPTKTEETLPILSTQGLIIPKGRNPQVVAAARERQAGRMSKAEYDKYVNKYMPIGTVDTPRPPASLSKMKEVLKSNQVDKINPDIPNGTRVGLRMDINALQKGGSVVSIHEGGKTLGSNIGYSSTARVKNVTFTIRSESSALKIATGENYKAPQQTVEGEWVKSTPEQDYKDIQSLLKNPNWKQVSLDPLRHSYFYDRESTNPVKSADEVIQVGNFLLAKNVKLGNKEDYLYQQESGASKIVKEEQEIEKQLKGKSLLEVSRWTIDNAPNKFAKAIATMVDKRLNEMSRRGIKFDFDVQSGNKRITSLYNARGLMISSVGKTGEETKFKVVLNGAAVLNNQNGYPSGMRFITVLHELLHVATRAQLALRLAKDPLVQELTDLRNLVVKDFNKRVKEGKLTPFLDRIHRGEINPLQDIDELVSWGLTDKDTQEYLSDIKVGDKTLFNKLVDIIRQVLGISKDYETALDRLVKTSESILNEDVRSIAGKLEEHGFSFGQAQKPFTGEQQTLFEKATNNFKRWFGDSKVVDENGEPLIVYHGTNKSENGKAFTYFDTYGSEYGLFGQGSYFTDNLNIASDYSKKGKGSTPSVYPVYLSLKNPINMDIQALKKDWAKAFPEVDFDNEYKPEKNSNEGFYKAVEQYYVDLGNYPKYEVAEIMQDGIRSMGYDGITHIGGGRVKSDGTKHQVYIAFEPTQIKSAIGNNGEYNSTNPDIRYEMSMEGVDPKISKAIEKTFGKQEPKSYVETIKDLAKRYRDRFKYMVADEFVDISNVSKTGYWKARLSKTVDTQMQVILDYGHLEVRGGTLGYKAGTKGLKAIYAPLGNEVERFQVWVALNRDAQLPKEKRSFDEELVSKRNDLIKGSLNGVPRAKLYEQARKEQQELNVSVLDVSKQLGLIDDDAYTRFKADAFYIPFYKEMENGDVEGARIASKLTGQKFSHALKGGEKKVNDLMDNMLRNWSHIIAASLKNDAALTTLKDAERLGVAVRVKDFQKANTGVVKVMEDGKPTYFKVDDQDLIDNIAQINYVGKQSALFKAMTKPSNWLRYGVTLNPAYKIRNLVKDTVTTIGVSDANPNVVANFQRGWELTNKANLVYADALASGAIFLLGSSHDGKSADLIKKLIAEGTPDSTILNTQEKMTSAVTKAFKAYQALGDRLENVNRLALYDKLIKEGKSPLEAAYESRDLLDFTSQGASRSLKVLSQLVPFMNTRIQGLYKLYRTGTDAQKQERLMYTLGAIAIASGTLYLMNKDDDDFKKRPDWDRDNFWWFKIGDTAFRIPKPYEIGGIGTLTERGLEQFADDSVESKVFFSRMGQYFLDTLSLDPTPQAIKPMWNVLNNRDSFTGAPIETPGMERYTKTQRYGDRTSGVAKGLSETINYPLSAVGMENAGPSPVQIDYLAQGYLGWLGGLVGSTAARAFEDKPTKPLLDAIGIAQTEPETNSKYITDFYQSNAKIQNYFNDMKRYAEQGDNEKVAEILKEKGDLIGLQKLYNQTVNQLAQQRKYIQMVSEQHDIPSDERQKMIVAQKIVMSKMAENVENIRKSLK